MTLGFLGTVPAVLALILTAAAPAWAETFVGSSVESRVMLGFKVADEKAAALLPEGWAPLTIPKGPTSGTNLFLSMFDRAIVLDAEGKPEDPSSDRAAAFVVYGVKEGVPGARVFVTRVFEAAPLSDTYSNSVAAGIARSASSEGASDGVTRRVEDWTITLDDGASARFSLDYAAGTPGWSKGNEVMPYSSANPEFHRIYRYDQLVDLAMNAAIGRPLNGTAVFTADPGFDAALDGSETLNVVLVIPAYIREVWLP